MNPINVLVAPHLLSVILLFGSNWIKKELSLATLVISVTALAFYALGVSFASIMRQSDKWLIIGSAKDSENKYSGSLTFVLAVLFDFFAFQYLALIFSRYGLAALFSSLSDLNIAQQSGLISGSFEYGLYISFPLVILIIKSIKSNNYTTGIKIILAVQLILCFVPFIISARRGNLFTLLLFSILYILISGETIHSRTANKQRKFKQAILLTCIISISIWFMSLTQDLMNKSVAREGLQLFGIRVPEGLVDPVTYIAGNYSYFDKVILGSHCLLFNNVLQSTLRMAYLYILPIFGISVDATTPFANEFLNIGNNGYNLTFNTQPIFYYAILDAGILFPIIMFLMGYLVHRAYKTLQEGSDAGTEAICCMILITAFWSFRSYELIFLSTWLIILYSFLIRCILRRRNQGLRGEQNG